MRDTDPMTKKEHQQQMPQTLAALRLARGLTITEVAERMGVGQPRVTQIEARFPNVNYATFARYMAAIDGRVLLSAGDARVYADELIPDPDRAGTRAHLASRPGMGRLVYVRSGTTEKLPLEQSESGTGGDDTGREIDQPDPEGDQTDGEDRQET